MEKLKKKLLYLVATNYGRLILFAIIFIISALTGSAGLLEIPTDINMADTYLGRLIFENPKHWYIHPMDIPFGISVLFFLGYLIVAMVYAWIINPFKNKIK
tara:strand:- start:947 stop:1249 length:303 start_codon:yes stop_codon:yes gene_type:complete